MEPDDGSEDGDDDDSGFVDQLMMINDEAEYGVVGKQVLLTCVLTSIRDKKISWTKDGFSVNKGFETDSETNFEEDFNADVYTITSTLTVTTPGVYSCKNAEISEESEVFFANAVEKSDDFVAEEGEVITMTCQVPAMADLVFFLNDEEIKIRESEFLKSNDDGETIDDMKWVTYTRELTLMKSMSGDKYKCQGSFGDDVVVSHVYNIEVLTILKIAVDHEKVSYYVAETDIVILCKASREVEGGLKWFKTSEESDEDSEVLAIEDRILIEAETPEGGTTHVSVLTFKGALLEDSGTYYCQGEEDKTNEFEIQVHHAVENSDDFVAEEGEVITMTCQVPVMADLVFFLNDEEITRIEAAFLKSDGAGEAIEGMRWVTYSRELTLWKSMSGDKYECQGRFGDGVIVSHVYNIEVLTLLKITVDHEGVSYYATETDVVIKCEATRKVEGGLKWFKTSDRSDEDREVLAMGDKIIIEAETPDGGTTHLSVLTFKGAVREDSGIYYCQGDDTWGEGTSDKFEIQVYPVIVVEKSLAAREGDSITMVCEIPKGAQASFFLDGVQEKDDFFTAGAEKVLPNGDILIPYIKEIPELKIQIHHETKYKCEGHFDDLKVADFSFGVEVGDVLTLKVDEVDEPFHKIGDSMTFVCTANQAVVDGIQWYKALERGEQGADVLIEEVQELITITEKLNEKEESVSTIVFASLAIENSGQYYCVGEETKSQNSVRITVFEVREESTDLSVYEMIYFNLQCWSYLGDFNILREGEKFTAYKNVLDNDGDNTIPQSIPQDTAPEQNPWQLLTLKMRLSKELGGEFECISKFNDFVVAHHAYTITVNPIGTTSITPEDGYPMVAVGSDITLTCTLSIKEEVALVWYKDNSRFKEAKETFEDNLMTSLLVITDLTVADSGDYVCDTVSQGAKSHVTVSVYDPKNFQFEEYNLEKVGTVYNFVCYAVTDTPLTLSWAGQDVELTSDKIESNKIEDYELSGLQMDRYDISITIESIADAGSYGCSNTAFGNEIFSLMGNLDVFSPPTVYIEGVVDGKYYPMEGDDFTVRASFSSSADLTAKTAMQIKILRVNAAPVTIDLIDNIRYDEENKEVYAVYEVTNILTANSGTYKLFVQIGNQQTESEPIEISVRKHKDIEKKVSLAIGADLVITCYAPATDTGSFQYFIGEEKQTPTGLEEGADVEDDGQTYKTSIWTISEVTQEDNGVYTCRGFEGDVQLVHVVITFNVHAFSNVVNYVALPLGTEAVITCYLAEGGGAYLKYFYNNEVDASVKPEIGERFEDGGVSYVEYLWNLGDMVIEFNGDYKCESFVNDKMVTSITTKLMSVDLKAPEGVVADSASETVACTYSGPNPAGMSWYLDGEQVEASSGDVATAEADGVRTDTLVISGLSVTSVMKAVKCSYTLSDDYELARPFSRDILVTYAEILVLNEKTNFNSDEVVLECGYTGADPASITWFNIGDPEDPTTFEAIRTKNAMSHEYIEERDEGSKHTVKLYLRDLGYESVNLACMIGFKHTGQQLKFANIQPVKLERSGFSQELPTKILALPGELELVCIWGSSDTPETPKWSIDGTIPFFGTWHNSYERFSVKTTLSIDVTGDEFNTEYKCLMSDKSGNTAESTTTVYGATLTIDKGAEFFPTPDDNKATCTFSTAAAAMAESSQSWQKAAEGGDKQEVVAAVDGVTSIAFLEIDPGLDGDYSCLVEGYDTTLTATTTVTNVGVVIEGPPTIQVTEEGEITLTCTAASRDRVYRIMWDVNGERPANNADTSKYVVEDFIMTSELVINPVADAALYGSHLKYTCSGKVKTGTYTDFVEVTLRGAQIKDPNRVVTETSWELSCTVITDIIPQEIKWMKGDEVKKSFTDFNLRSSKQLSQISRDGQSALPGTAEYVVNEGVYNFRQVENDFIMSVTESTYKDSGTFTCVLVFESGQTSSTTAEVSVRTIVSALPDPFVTALPVAFVETELECLMYGSEAPTTVSWFKVKTGSKKNKREKVGSDLQDMGSDLYKSVLSLTDPSLDDAGTYECDFEFDDDHNPSYALELVFAHIAITSNDELTLQTGDELKLTATVYSSTKFVLKWYRGETLLTVPQGYLPDSKQLDSGVGFEMTLTKSKVDETMSGRYTAEITSDDPEMKITSTEVSLAVIGGSSETSYINSGGEALTLTCNYEGSVAPEGVAWTYREGALDTDKWTVSDGTYGNEAQESTISAPSMVAADTGNYECVFTVNGLEVKSSFVVTVRQLVLEKTGMQYITTGSWTNDITLHSTTTPQSFFVYKNDKMIVGRGWFTKKEKTDTKLVYTLTLTYDFDTKAGTHDGTYYFAAVFDDGAELKTAEVTIVARLALTRITEELVELITPEKSVKFFLSCQYNGVAQPDSLTWWLDGTQVVPDDTHVVQDKARSIKVSDTLSYKIIVLGLTVTSATWQDGGIYTCKFDFTDGNNVEVAIPRVALLYESRMESCVTATGTTQVLECKYESKVAVTAIKWFRWKVEVEDGLDTSSFQDNAISSSLTITDGDAASSGRYYCEATFGTDLSTKAQTDVKFVSLTLAVSSEPPYLLGSRIVVTCSKTGKFKKTAIYHNGEKTGEQKRYSFSVNSDNAGEYTCVGIADNTCENPSVTAVTAAGADSITVAVQLPEVITQPQDEVVSDGDEVNLSCVIPFVSGANVKVKWYKEGSEKIIWPRTTIDEEAGTMTSIMKIKSAGETSQGKYRCIASYNKSPLESDWASVYIVRYQEDPADITALLGGDAKFTCIFASTAATQISLKNTELDTIPGLSQEDSEDSSSGVATTSVFTLAGLTADHAQGEYSCLTETGTSSKTATLTVIAIKEQPQASYVVEGTVAAFTVRVDKFKWPGVTVTWQNKVGETWTDVTPGEKYKVQIARAKQWYTFINVLDVQDGDPTEFRAKITFPENAEKGLVGGDLISDSAMVEVIGKSTVGITATDSFVGTAFTFTCTFTARKAPPYIDLLFNGKLVRGKKKFSPEITFENNLAKLTVVGEIQPFLSGKTIGCETSIGYKQLETETTFATSLRSCDPPAERTNGVINLEDKVEADVVVGVEATLVCDAANNYQPVGETTATCLYSAGEYTTELGRCSEVIPIDLNAIFVTLFLRGAQSYCDTDPEELSVIDRYLNADATCGWKNMGFPCYDNGDCDFRLEESTCKVGTNSGGSAGIDIVGVFYYTGDDLDQRATYITQSESILPYFGSNFFSSDCPDRNIISVSVFSPGDETRCNDLTDSHDPMTNKEYFIERYLNADDSVTCGWRNIGFPCYDNGDCILKPDDSSCSINEGGDVGVNIVGVFYYVHGEDWDNFEALLAKRATYTANAEDVSSYYNEANFFSSDCPEPAANKRKRSVNNDESGVFVHSYVENTMSTEATTTSPTSSSVTTEQATTEQATTKQATTKQATTEDLTTEDLTTKQATTADLTTYAAEEVVPKGDPLEVVEGEVLEEVEDDLLGILLPICLLLGIAFLVGIILVIYQKKKKEAGYSYRRLNP